MGKCPDSHRDPEGAGHLGGGRMRPECSRGVPRESRWRPKQHQPHRERLCWGNGCSGVHPARAWVPLRPDRMLHYLQLLIPVGISLCWDNITAVTVEQIPLPTVEPHPASPHCCKFLAAGAVCGAEPVQLINLALCFGPELGWLWKMLGASY